MLASAALVAAIALAGCNADMVPNGRAQAPLSEKMLSEIASKNMDKESPILVRIFKEESELEVWKQTRDGEYALLKSYPVCRWSGDLGPKKKEGDRQAPEGFYTITPGQMNPNSSYYLAFNTGFPNAYDRSHGFTGSELMVHGDCSSRGCYAMTDEQIQEIYALARESFFGGQKAFQLQAFPFRMTAMNMARHRNSPHFAFWKMLKEGYDHFEASKQEPKVAVCEKKYVFDPAATDDKPLKFNAAGKCPVYQLDQNIADAVLDHRRKEQVEMASYIAQGVATAKPRHGIDGGMNQVFAEKLGTQDGYDSKGRPIQVATAPGSLPRGENMPAPATVVSVPRAPDAQPEPQIQLASVPVPQPAPDSSQAAAKSSTIGGLIGNLNLFGNSGTAAPAQVQAPPPAPAAAAPRPAPRPLTRTANAAPATPPAKPKAGAAVPAPASPRVAQAEPSTAESAPQLRTAFSAQPANNGSTLTGAQPVMPVGSFDQRWSGSAR